jgi:hypothetical protein
MVALFDDFDNIMEIDDDISCHIKIKNILYCHTDLAVTVILFLVGNLRYLYKRLVEQVGRVTVTTEVYQR